MKQYKTESKRLLDLMINSIYTNKDIFLRELISNASDASDKLYFESIQNNDIDVTRDELKILVDVDKEKRTISITDYGIGMNESEIEKYLGTIAKSDSHAFKEALEDDEKDPVDIIGQFGVGFYSAFMVSDKIEVITRRFDEDQAYRFVSSGLDGYEIDKVEKKERGTTVICHVKENVGEENFERYLEVSTLRFLIEKYSDYIRYPIQMKTEEDEWETINSMIPLWKRSKNEVSEEELNQFYKEKFFDFEDPLHTIQMKVEGVPSFDALLYIPKRVPANFYSTAYEPGLQLYSRGVYIMEKNKDLLPEHFRFVRGLVDSPDLSLNISREILQHDRQLQLISRRVERKIKSELELMMRNDREKYEQFWEQFGLTIKYGTYAEFGAHKEKLQDLILFKSSKELSYTSLKEYVERMKEDQKDIYYVSGETIKQCQMSPQAEYVVNKGYEVLYLDDEIDEFVIQILQSYDEHSFKSVHDQDLDLADETEKEALKEKLEESKDLIEALKEALKEKVDDVILSNKLISHPVCLSSDENMSFEMEKVLNMMPEANNQFKAKRILEINPEHALLDALESVHQDHPELLEEYAQVLYDQACLIEGLEIEDPVAFSKRIADLMVHSTK